jgi:protein gp37
MATVTTIEWTERTWNPVTGCSKVSQGCKHCYAERIAERFWGDRPFTEVQCHPDRLAHPKSIRKGSMFFVNSMSDLFHPDVPDDFIRTVFRVMADCSQHTFQVLTKRTERLAELSSDLPWPENIWMGVSVEDANVIDRIDHLRTVPAAVRFLSLEPLIGPLDDIDLDGMHWVIVGGESGPGARSMKATWVRSLRRQCRTARVPFFFKQWGGVFKKHSGRELDGRTYSEFPRNEKASSIATSS